MKLTFIFGTRPEAIKIIPLIHYLQTNYLHDNNIEWDICLTGQHDDMLYQVLDLFDIKADHDFRLMNQSNHLNNFVSECINKVHEYLAVSQPDILIVHGDTSSALAASLAAFHNNIKIAHIEAGLRTHDITQPFPEEFNRITIDNISNYLFAPTEANYKNIQHLQNKSIHIVGNTIVDSINLVRDKLNTSLFQAKYNINPDKPLVFTTVHRRENHGDNLHNIITALDNIASQNIQILLPVHPNPNVKDLIYDKLNNHSNIILTEPLDYIECLNAMNMADCILTDSGGLQEEAPSFGKHVFILRNTTERPEIIDSGYGTLVGTNINNITNNIYDYLNKTNTPCNNSKNNIKNINPFGDGQASCRIISTLLKI